MSIKCHFCYNEVSDEEAAVAAGWGDYYIIETGDDMGSCSVPEIGKEADICPSCVKHLMRRNEKTGHLVFIPEKATTYRVTIHREASQWVARDAAGIRRCWGNANFADNAKDAVLAMFHRDEVAYIDEENGRVYAEIYGG